MDHTLRCNSLKCRKVLNDHAVVTTCSHVFCTDCSNSCQLSGQRQGSRVVCPVCGLQLTNPDDAVIANLNPTEDYKSSVLSGLSPNVIMECAGRGLSFWAYQATQEIVYQEHLAKSLTDKYTSLSAHMDKIIHDANGEISNLQSKMSNMAVDQDNLRHKNEELIQAFREKSRKLLQTQELYDKLKRRDMLGQVQNAASEAVDHTIEASVTTSRFTNIFDNQNQNQSSIQASPFSGIQNTSMQYYGVTPAARPSSMGPPIGRPRNRDGTLVEFGCAESVQQNQPSQTPSTHRQRLAPGIAPTPRIGSANIQLNSLSGTPFSRGNSTGRSPLASLNGNSAAGSGFAGYGMSAGLKVSNPANPAASSFARPFTRSRVAQRPAAGFPPPRNPKFGPQQTGNIFSTGEHYY